ncbi:PREDICTED: myeloid cell surface antigen CD33-like [Chinchilla lanigera]|uniref:myeloid cell surface antigen CD33-like n=1 Tax=Chinchilla lanigera TaxID=34839 RepID=UPI000696EBC3|nr:PREDICTED: myeloid cell surface antigen CD33-like [Chinchilla lanigera]
MLLPALLLPVLWAGSLQEEPSYWLKVEKSVTVQENLCVVVSCSFSYPQDGWNSSTPAYGYWYRQRNSARVDHTTDELVATNNAGKKAGMRTEPPFQLLGDLRVHGCSLRITGAQKRDSGVYYFRVERGEMKYSFMNPTLTLTVTELTQTLDIRIPELLVSGHTSQLVCSMPGACSGAMAPTFSWSGAALRRPGSGLGVHSSSEIAFTPHPQDHGTNLTCRVTFPTTGVTKERTVQLSVSYPPENLTVSVTGAHGTGLQAPPRCSLSQGRFLFVLDDCREGGGWGHGIVLGESPASVRQTRRARERGCRALAPGSALFSPRSRGLLLHLPLPPPLSPAPHMQGNGSYLQVHKDQLLRLLCAAESRPPATLTWVLEHRVLLGSPPSAPSPLRLELPGVQPADAGRYTCAQNVHGVQGAAVLWLREKPELGKGFLVGISAGAGLALLLSMCTCLVFSSTQTHRKENTRTVASQKDTACTSCPECKGHRKAPWADAPLDAPACAAAAEEERELQYASLSFQGLSPREPRGRRDSSISMYAVICK